MNGDATQEIAEALGSSREYVRSRLRLAGLSWPYPEKQKCLEILASRWPRARALLDVESDSVPPRHAVLDLAQIEEKVLTREGGKAVLKRVIQEQDTSPLSLGEAYMVFVDALRHSRS